ncbi:MAG: redoxin domain-containing protein [Bacteroidota bacterium]
MTYRPLIITVLFVLTTVIAFSQGYRINTKVHNQNDTVAYLGHHFATQRYLDDTAKVVNGVAVFEGDKELTEGIYFYYSPSQYFEFLIGEQQFSIEGTAPDIITTAKIKGSPINLGFFEMQRYTSTKRKEAKELQTAIDSATDEAEKEELTKKLKAIDKEVKDMQKSMQVKHPGSILDRLIRLMQSPEVSQVEENNDQLARYKFYKSHYWEGIDIADPGLIRSPLLHNKIIDYLDNVVIQQADSVIKEIDELLESGKKSEEAFRYLLITLTNKYEASPVMGFDRVFVHLVDNYYATGQATWSDAETVKKLTDRAATMRPNFIGNTAPGFVMQDTLGTDYKLEDFHARYTVLYFYDPDCGHCKKTTPLLYEMYPELQAKDVEVLAINTTTDGKRWRKYIRDNELEWHNLADLENKTYFKYFYDIRSTPMVYILDKDKKIALKKIAVEDIPEIIDRLIEFEDSND